MPRSCTLIPKETLELGLLLGQNQRPDLASCMLQVRPP